MNIKNVIPGIYPIITVIVIMFASGCSTPPSQKTNPIEKKSITQPIAPVPNIETAPEPTAKTLQQEQISFCRQALDSLKKVNPSRARKLDSDFNSLVNAASQYNAVRGQVGGTTRQAIDSMYQFKSIKLCADIDKELMDSLVLRGESAIR